MGRAVRFGRHGARLAEPVKRVLAPTTAGNPDKASNPASMAWRQGGYVCAGNFLTTSRVFGMSQSSCVKRHLAMTSASVFEAAALRSRLSGVPCWGVLGARIGVGYRHAIGQLEHEDKLGVSARW
jgi:hypothetical protein